MNKDVITNLKKMIDVNTPVIYIHDYDFTRVDFMLKETLGPETEIREWSPAFGYQQIKLDDELNLFRDEFAAGKDATLNDVLNTLLSDDLKEPTYLLLRDVHELIDDIEIKSLIQMLAQRKLYDLDFDLTIIINSSLLYVPKEIEKYVSFLEIPYPTDDEIKMLIKQHVVTNGYNKEFKDEHIKNLMPSLKGMTLFEIDRMLDMAMSSGGTLTDEDKEMILRHKKQMVKKSGILELVDSPEKISSIGGLENLKKYLEKKSKIIKNIGEAIKCQSCRAERRFHCRNARLRKIALRQGYGSTFRVSVAETRYGLAYGQVSGREREKPATGNKDCRGCRTVHFVD